MTQIMAIKAHKISPANHAYLQSLDSQEIDVIVQMEEIHVNLMCLIKGGIVWGQVYEPTRSVFSIMVSRFHKKWSCKYHLLHCASIIAEKIFNIIKLVYLILVQECKSLQPTTTPIECKPP